MRLWSVSPNILDSKGLVACWREGLLALNVLQGKTKGYKNHPQLNRFKECENPIQAITNYLHTLVDEADNRGYKFDRSKLPIRSEETTKIKLTKGQLEYEFQFLRQKVLSRNPEQWIWEGQNLSVNLYNKMVFTLVNGDIEMWEKVKEL